MGGKSQPRVAGNAKPSSSGRIRELLENKHGVGNVLTFSALSNKQPKQEQPPNVPKIASPPEIYSPTELNSSKGSVLKPTLVTRRVGDREYFTRVRISEDALDKNKKDDDGPANAVCSEAEPSNSTDFIELTTSELPRDTEGDKDDNAEGSVNDQGTNVAGEVVPDFDTVLDKLEKIKKTGEENRFDSLEELPEEHIQTECEMMKLLDVLIRNFKQDLSIEEWDLILSSIRKWVGLISKSHPILNDLSQTKFCVNLFEFIHELLSTAKKLKQNENLEEEFPMMHSILDDWANFHSSSVYQDLVIFYLELISMNRNHNYNAEQLEVIEALAQIVIDADPKLVMSDDSLVTNYLDTKIEFDPELELPKESRYCELNEKKLKNFIAVSGLLRSNHRVILVPAHLMLSRTISDVCEDIKNLFILTDQDDLDTRPIFPPTPMMALLTSRDSMMSALLSDYRAGDVSVSMEPNTDSYGCTLSYLFLWDLTIQLLVGLDKELTHRMIHSFKKLGERDSLNLRMATTKDGDQRNWTLVDFLESPLKTPIKRPFNEIELVALHVYFSIALRMPVTVRKWFNNNSNKRLCNLVNEYTVKHISQVICSLEMDTVQKKCQQRASAMNESNNLVIRARPTAKEVYAVYIRDEFKMELTIKLPNNYPLGPVQIDGGKRVGVTDLKWRSWLLQLTTFLSHQNGPILDGIDLWKRNIDKRFEGVEKCTICFSILHSNYQLPKKKCQTCTKMFHNLCLYKWFESSGNSTCPLCRNPW